MTGERVRSESGRITINPSGTTLTIGLVYASDAGTYECVAESAGGRRTAAAQLSVITQGTFTPSLVAPKLRSRTRRTKDSSGIGAGRRREPDAANTAKQRAAAASGRVDLRSRWNRCRLIVMHMTLRRAQCLKRGRHPQNRKCIAYRTRFPRRTENARSQAT